MMDSALVTSIWENEILRKGLWLIVSIVLVYFLSKMGKKAINRLIQDTNQKYKARKGVNFLSYLLVVLGATIIFSNKLGNLGVFLGVIGAGIAFTLQEVFLSFAGWLVIAFSNKVVVGHRVKVGDIKGDIIDIGILNSTIMEIGDWVNGDLYNGRITTVPNSFVFKEKIQNYSSEYPFLWDEIRIPIKHGSDHRLAREKFLSVANDICEDYANQSTRKWNEMTNKFNIENAYVKPMVSLTFDQNWITFTIRYVVDYKKRRMTADAIYSTILALIEKEPSIKIAASAMEVSLPGGSQSSGQKAGE